MPNVLLLVLACSFLICIVTPFVYLALCEIIKPMPLKKQKK